MKNFKSFILFTVIGILAGFLISCGNKDEKDIIALKKASREKAAKSITEFSNEYFMDGDIEKTVRLHLMPGLRSLKIPLRVPILIRIL